jgi:hypothetical protein
MAPPTILAKLKRELNRDLTEESQVVYILAEICKLIESAKELEDYFALDFHCSLALHTTMSKAGARQILERFETAYPLLIRGEELPTELRKEIEETVALKKFRDQLKQFLDKNGLLPARMFPGTPDPWVKFIYLYANVVDECELQLKGDRRALLDRITIHLKTPTQELGPEWGGRVLFALCWTCHGKDGGTGDHDVYFSYSPEKSAGE